MGNFHFQWLGGTKLLFLDEESRINRSVHFYADSRSFTSGFVHLYLSSSTTLILSFYAIQNLIVRFNQRQTQIDAEMTERFDLWF